MRLFLPFLAAAVLGGCQSPSQPLPYSLTLSAEGLGPIRTGASMDASTLQGKLPGFSIEKMSQITPEQPKTLFILKREDALIAYLFPDEGGKRIGRISVLTPLVPDDTGRKVGDILPPSADLHCENDLCRYDQRPDLSYRISHSNRIIREITLQKL